MNGRSRVCAILALSVAALCLPLLAAGRSQFQIKTDVTAPPVELNRAADMSSSADDGGEARVFVMQPLTSVSNGYLNGYRIGAYPEKPLNNNPIYLRPQGFIEVTKDNSDAPVSPYFTLKQFLCKQASGYPQYVVLNDQLLVKLDLIVKRLNHLGHKVNTLHIMSGYRTPYYNKAIGNVTYSLHQYGRAADIFVDADGDERMDDLNKDGKIDLKDAVVLRDIVQTLFDEAANARLAGGVGLYDSTTAHGPFVHVDVRGYSAKW